MTTTSGDNPSSRKVLSSASWAMAQQFVTLGATGATSVILARTLSVEEFGIFSYAVTLASIGTTVVTAGLSGLAIRALVEDKKLQPETMTSLILIREFFGFFAFCILLGVAFSSGDDLVFESSALALAVLFARGFDATEYWFQARVESGKTAPIRIGVVLAMLLLRGVLAFSGVDLTWFVFLYVVEGVLVSIGLFIRFRTAGGRLKFSSGTLSGTTSLLKDSWILLLSGIAGQVNSRGDILLLQLLTGSASVGLYASAARISEVFYFLPAVFMTALMPGLISARRAGTPGAYQRQLQRSYDLAFWIGALISLGLFLLGPWVIAVLFGESYAPAGVVLQIHVLALPFVFMAAVYSKWIIIEGFLLASLWRHLLGAILNILLNLMLIPQLGIVGAAWASVASYFFASYLVCFLGRSTRPAGNQMTLAIAAPARFVLNIMKRRGSSDQ
ncbi:flippase [Arthrobacter sp. TMT4-20]